MAVTRQQSQTPSPASSAEKKPRVKRHAKARAKRGHESLDRTKQMADEIKKVYAQQRRNIITDHSKKMTSLRNRLTKATQKLIESRVETHKTKMLEYVELVQKRRDIEKEILHKINEMQHRTRDLMLRMEVALAGRIRTAQATEAAT